jgi:mannose-1-phosphate guanylyltransferase
MRHALILAGGSGTRLWPMSRTAMPKQLIPFINGRSLLSIAYERLEGLIEAERRLVCAAEAHRAAVKSGVKRLSDACFLGEPAGRDTLSAIGYGAAVIARQDPEAVMGVFTADHLIEPEDRFRRIVDTGYRIAEECPEALVTFGIAPTYPATGFGYLNIGKAFLRGSRIVKGFREKPDARTARSYLAAGPERHLWNSGMFVWRASAFLDCVGRYEPETRAGLSRIADSWQTPRFDAALAEAYGGFKKISVDFAVMEKASRDPRMKVAAVAMDLSWRDIGSWPAFGETLPRDDAGNAVAAGKALLEQSSGCLVVSEDPGHLIALMGCEDMVVVHTPEATLVCRKDAAEDVKRLQALASERFGPRYT